MGGDLVVRLSGLVGALASALEKIFHHPLNFQNLGDGEKKLMPNLPKPGVQSRHVTHFKFLVYNRLRNDL